MRRELKALGLDDLPIIGLAKEREEIFRPGESRPLVLDPTSGAIRLLQRIRDEAHRFANGYHQLLMKQRVNESVLDEVPGVSENRKRLLLRHFGSIERLRHATVEQIREIEGIGPKLAETLVDFFAKLKRRGATAIEDAGDETGGELPAGGPVEVEPGVVSYTLKPSPGKPS
jgi:excinuclease ABC subunit C